jgi:tetratricopeptide (TPR) repeat protein
MTRKTIFITTLIAFVLSSLLLSGCPKFKGKTKPNPKLAAQYIEKGKALEKKGALAEANEQYKLALTVDPPNAEAAQNAERLSGKLSKLADARYRLGMKYYRQGKYGLARKEFLTALKYQPDHPKASKMLVSRKPKKSPGYVMHEIQKGESLSIIAKKYYGDYNKFNIIARFNNMEDATHVKPGQTIMIPDIQGSMAPVTPSVIDRKAAGFVWHTIEPGQSISKLAQIYYGDYRQFHVIAQYNEMDDATRIKVGDRVKVPKVGGLPFNDPAKMAVKSPDAPYRPEVQPPPPAETAVPQPEEAIAEEPAPTDSNGDEQARAYRDAGINLYYEAKYEDAIFELNKAIEAVPKDSQTRTYLAKAYFESGKALLDQEEFDAAREAFESSHQYNPQCEECDAYIEKAKTGPALTYRAKGIDYLNRNDFSAAITEFKKYLLTNPGDADGRTFLSKAYFQKALIDYNKGDFMSAKQGFESALDYDNNCAKCPDYVMQSLNSYKESHYNKGVVYYGKQQLTDAIAEWEMVYDLDPAYKDVEQNLKKARALLNRLEKIKKSRQP